MKQEEKDRLDARKKLTELVSQVEGAEDLTLEEIQEIVDVVRERRSEPKVA